MKKKITIVDYGSGNLLSAKQSFVKVANLNNINADIKISSDPQSLKESSHVVLPGQGAFKTCMDGIKKIPGMQDQLNDFVKIKKRPFFGICVGMQLLADISEENGTNQGFGWVRGKIKKLPSTKTIILNPDSIVSKNSVNFAHFEDLDLMYTVRFMCDIMNTFKYFQVLSSTFKYFQVHTNSYYWPSHRLNHVFRSYI